MPTISRFRLSVDYRNLFIVLTIGLIHGLIYIYLIPPWQHYDEPNHFEYAWLIANHNQLPAAGDYDNQMRVGVARSMLEHNFFRGVDLMPDLEHLDRPVWIGPASQLANPPLYYLIASMPLHYMKSWDMGEQLIGVRFVSLGFYLLTLLAAWGIAIEITPERHPLRVYLPLTLAMLPGLVDVMTAVNNDAAAIAFFSLFLWGCSRLILQGIRMISFVITLVLVILMLFTKETAFAALPLFVIALFLVFLKGRYRRAAWVLAGIASLTILFVTLSRGDAAEWFRSTAQADSTRGVDPQAALGEFVFQLDASAGVTPRWSTPLYQPIPVQGFADERRTSYTVGAWIWADAPAIVNAPVLGNGNNVYTRQFEVGVEPAFYAYTVDFPVLGDTRLWIVLNPGLKNADIRAYYDGVVLVQGEMNLEKLPRFNDVDGSEGVWGDTPFTNLVRNGSAEEIGIRIAPWMDDLGARFLPDQTRPSSLLMYFLDAKNVIWHYRLTAERLFRTFWAEFGWGHVSLLGNKPYRPLALASLVGMAGFLLWLIRRIRARSKLSWDMIFFFGIVLLIVWGGVISRGVLYLGNNRLYLPVARYAYPAIIPTLLVLCTGWNEWFNWLSGWKKVSRFMPAVQMVVWFGLLFILAAYSIVSITAYYRYPAV